MIRLSGARKKVAILFALCIALGIVLLVIRFFPTASNVGYAPEQPIPFSHQLHARDHKIDCKYCHDSAEHSRHATIPSVAKCMNCHSVVKTDSPWIQKLKKLYTEGKPVEWIRVHELPDFVYFSHKRHLAKGLKCEECHGDVKSMHRIEQKAPLTMGWCMDCHRGVTTPRSVLKTVYPHAKDPQGPVAPITCNTCHN